MEEIKEAIEFLQLTKEEARRIDKSTLRHLIKDAKKKWAVTYLEKENDYT